MLIFIDNKVGRLDGYSLMDYPKSVEFTVDDPFLFNDYIFDGKKLIHDPIQVDEKPSLGKEVDSLKGQILMLEESFLDFVTENSEVAADEV